MKKILFILLLSLTFLNSHAQKSGSLREEFVNIILSDTIIGGMGYLLPLKVKAEHTDTLIYYGQVQFLFQYFYEQYGWDGKTFMDTLLSYVLFDEVYMIQNNDTAYFLDTYKDLPLCTTCDLLYNETKEDLEILIMNKKYPRPRSDLFTCLIYKSFQKNIIIAFIEGEFLLGIFPPLRINEIDGTPLD